MKRITFNDIMERCEGAEWVLDNVNRIRDTKGQCPLEHALGLGKGGFTGDRELPGVGKRVQAAIVSAADHAWAMFADEPCGKRAKDYRKIMIERLKPKVRP